MDCKQPIVSIGMPVYNGSKFISSAIESTINQSYNNFELIISDNCSSDNTGEICRKYEKQDKRIKYVRNKKNIGAGPNFNRVLSISNGKYFKWAAHDDICKESYLEKCLTILEADDSIVLCHVETVFIDENDNILEKRHNRLQDLDSYSPSVRYKEIIYFNHWCFEIFGLIRRRILLKTNGIRSYIGSDRGLLSELVLQGRFYRVPEVLFFSREHKDRSVNAMALRDRDKWWDPVSIKKNSSPYLSLLKHYVQNIGNANINVLEKIKCYIEILRWAKYHRHRKLIGYDVNHLIKFYLKRKNAQISTTV